MKEEGFLVSSEGFPLEKVNWGKMKRETSGAFPNHQFPWTTRYQLPDGFLMKAFWDLSVDRAL